MWFSSFRCRFACIFMCSIEHWGEGHWQKNNSNSDNVRRVQITKLRRCVDIPLKWLRQVPAGTTCLSQSRRNSATHHSKKKSKQTKQTNKKPTVAQEKDNNLEKKNKPRKKKSEKDVVSILCLLFGLSLSFDLMFNTKKKKHERRGGKKTKKWE